MKRLILFLCTLFLFAPKPVSAIDISAVSAVLYEPVTGRILYSKNENEKRPMASTTKIVSAITAIERGNLEDIVTVSKAAADVEGSSVWLEEGEKMSLKNLIYGMLLSSGNDAAIAVAEHVGGNTEKFAQFMNETAQKAGAQSSNFMNPSGLDHENHYTTALDLAKITAYALKNPIFKEIVATKEYSIPWEGHEWNRALKNHNKLLRLYDGCTGVKTGFTKKSGRCLVSSAEREGVTLIAVTLNAPDDWNDHIKMLDYGFSQLHNQTIVEKGSGIGKIKVAGGIDSEVEYMLSETVTLPLLENDRTEIKNVLAEHVEAPFKTWQTVGYVDILLNGTPVKRVDLVTRTSGDKLYIPTVKDYLYAIFKSMI